MNLSSLKKSTRHSVFQSFIDWPNLFLNRPYIFVHHFPSLCCQWAAIRHGQVGHWVWQDGLTRKSWRLWPGLIFAIKVKRVQLQTEKARDCTVKDKACRSPVGECNTLPSRTYPIYDPATAPLVSSNSSLPSGLSIEGFLRRRFGSEFLKKEKNGSSCVLHGEICHTRGK